MNIPHKHRDLIIEWANGAVMQFRIKDDPRGKWRDCIGSPPWTSQFDYRIKPLEPRHINIGGVLVPEPLREMPVAATPVYLVTGAGVVETELPHSAWQASGTYLLNGYVHLTKSAAEQHETALIMLNNQPAKEL